MNKHVTISIYDADGELCESVGGRMGYEEVKDIMINTLRNDGIPVVRVTERGKGTKGCDVPVNKVKEHKEIVTEWAGVYHKCLQDPPDDGGRKEPAKGETGEVHAARIAPLLTLDWEGEGTKFHAFGAGQDVIDAQYDFLRMMTEEE